MIDAALRRACGGLLVAALAVAGCAGPAIRSQSPEVEALLTMEAETRLVGDYTIPWGMNAQRIERAALVTSLAGTGSDPPPNARRQSLMADMQARGVVEPNKLLASKNTSLVWVHGYLPPGVRKGDRFDVSVEVPSDCDTTSLAGGWLMETRLAEMAVLGSRIRDGHVLGIVEGPLLVDPVSTGTLDSKSKIRAIVPGGGVSLASRPIGLVLQPEHRSIAVSKRVGDCINSRFHTVIRGSKRGVATPKTDRFIELEIPSIYRHNLARYIRVVGAMAVVEPRGGRHARLELLGRQLADPVTAPSAALRLEAIGRDALITLKEALASDDAEVRFAAAEALAYLGESTAATHLADAAANLRNARPAALAALTAIDDANGIDALQTLLASPSAETRYGAFRALWMMDSPIPLVRGEKLGEACSLHVLNVDGPTLIHATRSHHPEIVLFGTEHPLSNGMRVEAGQSIVVVVEAGRATCTRFEPGHSDRTVTTSAQADAVLRAIAQLDGNYPDMIQFLQQATAQRSLATRLAFDALPADTDGRGSLHEEVSLRGRGIPSAVSTDPAFSVEPSTDESS
ncbi:MAG: flagellar basal body P-ring protein FlgI [Planctomycetia bacterium]